MYLLFLFFFCCTSNNDNSDKQNSNTSSEQQNNRSIETNFSLNIQPKVKIEEHFLIGNSPKILLLFETDVDLIKENLTTFPNFEFNLEKINNKNYEINITELIEDRNYYLIFSSETGKKNLKIKKSIFGFKTFYDLSRPYVVNYKKITLTEEMTEITVTFNKDIKNFESINFTKNDTIIEIEYSISKISNSQFKIYLYNLPIISKDDICLLYVSEEISDYFLPMIITDNEGENPLYYQLKTDKTNPSIVKCEKHENFTKNNALLKFVFSEEVINVTKENITSKFSYYSNGMLMKMDITLKYTNKNIKANQEQEYTFAANFNYIDHEGTLKLIFDTNKIQDTSGNSLSGNNEFNILIK